MKLPSWLKFWFTRKIPEGEYSKLLAPGLQKQFELSYEVKDMLEEPMITPGAGCRECSFKVSTVLDYDTDIAICPKCGAKYAVIYVDHHDMETGEKYQSMNLGDQLFDFPAPKNFQNPMGEQKK